MILPWMLYAGAVALLLGLAAANLETVIRQRGRPVRALWLGALIGSVGLPLLAAFFPRQTTRSTSAASLTVSVPSETAAQTSPEWWNAVQALSVGVFSFDPDPWVLGIWGITSAGMAFGILVSHARLQRRRRLWHHHQVDGRNVLISRDIGPAVIGFLRGRIVLPEWIVERDAGERILVLAHEEEHLQAGDPRLLLGAMLVLVALPWNLLLWWQWRRLRQAVELDCDLRVLARGLDPRAYSRLLVEVTERGRPHRLTVAAISEPSSFLERRIRLMLTSRTRHWAIRATGTSMLAGGLVLGACQMDRPEQSPIPTLGATYSVAPTGAMTPLPSSSIRNQDRETGRIMGVVLEASGQPVAGAKAVVGDRGAIARPDGRFIITGVPAGPQTLEVSSPAEPGKKLTKKVEVRTGETVTVRFTF